MKCCTVNTCKKAHVARGLCAKHYRNWRQRQPRGLCAFKGCSGPAWVGGLCEPCYARAGRNGTPDRLVAPPGSGYRTPYGYRMRKINGRAWMEHRLVWEKAHGPIPATHEIHHRNGVKDDNRLANLELIEIGLHRANHRRKYWFCTLPSCGKPHLALGLCERHHKQLHRTGTTWMESYAERRQRRRSR